ncbi:MAG: CidA/LrgA family protein [Oscillospiraceae bacterium]
MKYLYQFSIIISVTAAGELLHYFVPLPIPASIYGLAIMFFLLCTGLLKLESIKDASALLIEWMPVMFVPPAVALLGVWDLLRPILIPIVVISSLTTVLTMVSAGRVSQAIIRFGSRCRK